LVLSGYFTEREDVPIDKSSAAEMDPRTCKPGETSKCETVDDERVEIVNRGQAQEGGDGSTNVQAGGSVTIIQSGLSLEDAAEIARALVRPEFDRLADVATAAAIARAEDMISDRLLPRLQVENPGGIGTFGDPDVQYALLAAQRTYARTGDSDVADVLVDLLVDRTRATKRDVLQISLTEALEVAAKLTSDQYAALSLIWLLRYTSNALVRNQDSLGAYIDKYLAPLVPEVRTTSATFQHLKYAGCGTAGFSQLSVEQIIRTNYSGLFYKGFSEQQLSDAFPDGVPRSIREMTMECLNDSSKLQLNTINQKAFDARIKELSIEPIDAQKLSTLSGLTFSEPELRSYLIAAHPVMFELMETWGSSELNQMTLTSVGITIAHANCRRVIGESPADLSIWIN
jgi:hypothetical protein